MAHMSTYWPLTRHIPEGSCAFCISRTRSVIFRGCEQPFRNTLLKASISPTLHVYINTSEERLFPQTESSSYMWASAVTIIIMTVIQEQMGRADFWLSHITLVAASMITTLVFTYAKVAANYACEMVLKAFFHSHFWWYSNAHIFWISGNPTAAPSSISFF